jgi:hypothetical protein
MARWTCGYAAIAALLIMHRHSRRTGTVRRNVPAVIPERIDTSSRRGTAVGLK